MSEVQKHTGEVPSIPENFLSEYPLAFPTQYSLVKTRVEKYNLKHQSDFHPVDVALAIEGPLTRILSIPQKSVMDVTAVVPEQVNTALEASWKAYVYSEVFTGEISSDKNIDIRELEKIVLVLLGSDISLSDDEKHDFGIIIDFFIENNSALEVFSFLKEDSFLRINRSFDEYQNYNPSHFETYFRDYLGMYTSMTKIYDAYRGSLGDISDTDLQRKVLQFLRTIVKIRRYVNIPSVIAQNQKIQEAKSQEKHSILEEIYPLMCIQAKNNKDVSLSSPEAIFATLLRKYIFFLKKKSVTSQSFLEFSEFLADTLKYNDSYLWSKFQESIPENLALNPQNVEQDFKRGIGILLENKRDLAVLNTTSENDEIRVIEEKKQQNIQDEIAQQERNKKQKQKERYNSKENTLSFLFGVIQSELEKVRGDISKAVDNLKQNPNSEIWKLIKHHKITAQDMIQAQLYRINQESGHKFERKIDIFWQKVCSVLAELVSEKNPQIPIPLTPLSSASQIAYLIFSSQYAELRNHLPDGVYEDALGAHFENVGRVRGMQEKDSRDEFDFLDKINDQRSRTQVQNIKIFYNTTRAIPAWWITPDWKKMTLLKDSIWDLIRKNRIKKEQVVGGFDELLSQLQRQEKQIQVLEQNWRERMTQEEIQLYDDKKSELDILKQDLGSDYAEFFTDDGRSVDFYELLGEISSEIFLGESPFEKALKIQDELGIMKKKSNGVLSERKKILVQMIGELQSWKQLYIEEFVWTSEQRADKREQIRREKESRRLNIRDLFSRLGYGDY